MLPKQHRLVRSRDFNRVRRYGRSTGTPLLALYVLPTASPELRVGFSVSKKVGKAVVRNTVKRHLREAVRLHLPQIVPGHDLVFIARPAAGGAGHRQIAEAVVSALHRTRALRGSTGRLQNA